MATWSTYFSRPTNGVWTRPGEGIKTGSYGGLSVATPGDPYQGAAALEYVARQQAQANPYAMRATALAAAPAAAPNPFSVLANVKSPAVAGANASILDQLTNVIRNPASDVNTLKTTVKSPAMQTRIDAAGSALDTDVANHRASLADFTNAWLAGQPTATANAGQESAAIGRIYDSGPGGIAAALQRIAAQRASAITTQAQNAMRGATTVNNALRVGQPNSSYMDAQIQSQVGRIAADAAASKADQDRQDLLALLGMQTSAAGQRTALTDAAGRRALVPTQLGQQMTAGDLASLANLLGITQGNVDYQITSPTRQLAEAMRLLGPASALDLANTFYTAAKPFENTNANLFAPTRRAAPGLDMPQGDPLARLLQLDRGGGVASPAPQSNPFSPAANTDFDAELASQFWEPLGDGTYFNSATGQFTGTPQAPGRQANQQDWVSDGQGGWINWRTGQYQPATNPYAAQPELTPDMGWATR